MLIRACLEIGTWLIWKCRNELIFADITTNSASLIAHIRTWELMIRPAIQRDSSLGVDKASKTQVEVPWRPVPDDWMTMNSDGSVRRESDIVTGGGLVRNSLGICSLAFTINIGKCSITRAEIKAAITSFELTWEVSHRRVQLQVDSVTAYLILIQTGVTHQHAREVLQFRDLLTRDWLVEIKHVYRKGNKAADHLASLGHGRSHGLHLNPYFDSVLLNFLLYDSLSCSKPHSVNKVLHALIPLKKEE
ncbi:Putative ribonuclease H protein At1g65750 [Linum perenne]